MKGITCTDNFTLQVEHSNSTSSCENVPGLQHNKFYICSFCCVIVLNTLCKMFSFLHKYLRFFYTSTFHQRALQIISACWFWKGDLDFILVLHCNYMSIVHRFRYNELFMFAGNDVIAISSLGGASCYMSRWIRKARPRFYISVTL